MRKLKLDTPYVIGQLEKHKEIKEQVLLEISQQENFTTLSDPKDDVNISKSDWETSRWDHSRPWANTLMQHLAPHLSDVITLMGYVEFKIHELWFQQYEKDSGHGWHVHGSNWTNVYYLEFPEDCPKTEFLDPYTQKTICEFDVKEGDVITFPSYVIHRAPVNNSTNRKTIISWNMDTELKPGLYK